MKALQWMERGTVKVNDLPVPTIKNHEVLIRVKSAAICGTDLHIVTKGFPGTAPPLTLGHEFAGVIEQIGSEVSGWTVGDRVAVEPISICGQCEYCLGSNYDLCDSFLEAGFSYDGGIAEFVVADAAHIYPLPDTISFQEAAVLEPLGNIVRAVERGRVAGAQSVIVIGDGFEGLLFAQMAKKSGVPKVIVVGRHDYKLAIAKETGADFVINGKSEDAVQAALLLTEGRGAEVVFEAAGTELSIQQALTLVKKGGRMVLFGVCEELVPLDVYKIMQQEIEIIGSVGHAGVWEQSIQHVADRSATVAPYLRTQVPFASVETAFQQMINKEIEAVKVIVNMEA
ncbi:zinc-dependent alcohol dehydrogenase [Aneurinibacillus sp. REN35]|uniref:zinc-dependent alcohol dehydrogenase n=1 Tax=Aneurinibacillus sp. REN35 TaxID=3237286 RepID=UPI0035276300